MSIRIHRPDTWGDSDYWRRRVTLSSDPIQFGYRLCRMIEYRGRFEGRQLSRSLVIQTPWMYLPYYPLIDDKGHASVDLALWRDAGGGDFFVNLGILHRVILEAFGEVKSEYIDPIRAGDKAYPARLKLRGVPWKDVPVFDGMCEAIENRLRPEQRLRCLLTLRYIWDNGEMHGFKYELGQVQIADYDMRKCALPAVVPVAAMAAVDEKYACYDRMKRTGVAIPAICHKMTMDGMSASDIARWRDGGPAPIPVPGPAPAPPPIPPPLPLVLSTAPRIAMSALLLGKSQLKRAEEPLSRRKEPPPAAAAFTAPTMAQLLSARSGLRKVKISECG